MLTTQERVDLLIDIARARECLDTSLETAIRLDDTGFTKSAASHYKLADFAATRIDEMRAELADRFTPNPNINTNPS